MGLNPHPLFDTEWYLQQNPDVAAAGINPLQHYMTHGWREGRDPNPLFDTSYYLEQNPDVAEAGINPLQHYYEQGWTEGRNPHPDFQLSWYLSKHTDIKEAGIEPLAHFLATGAAEGRQYRPDVNDRVIAPSNDQSNISVTSQPSAPQAVTQWHSKFTTPGPEFEEFDPGILTGQIPETKLFAYYLPQFHSIPENDLFWGKGFTEWRQLSRALPRFPGHYQPRIPRDLGFYDLTDVKTLLRQADMAKAAGIHGFAFYYYWFNGKRVLERPIEQFLQCSKIDMPFFLMWANENWTRTWDGLNTDVLLQQDYRIEDETALLADLARHFKDQRYFRINGRPLFIIYRPNEIPNARDTFSRWRRRWQDEHGLDPLIFMTQAFGYIDPDYFGLDGAIEFPPHKLAQDMKARPTPDAFDPEFTGHILSYDDLVKASISECPPSFPLIKAAVPSWDNDARRPMRGMTLEGSSPKKYEQWLRQLVERSETNRVYGERIVAINAWNEWAEGAYLEPDVYYGAAYLNATARALRQDRRQGASRRIVIVSHDAYPHGAQLLSLHLSGTLKNDFGFDIDHICLGDGPLLDQYQQHSTLHKIDRNRIDDRQTKSLVDALYARGARVAIVNTTVSGGIVPLLKEAGFTVLCLVHELPELLRSYALNPEAIRIAERADTIVFASNIVKAGFETFTQQQVSNARIRPQGLYLRSSYRSAEDRQRIRADVRRELGLPQNARIVINSGYADHRKGFDLYVDILLDLVARDPDVYGLWVGHHEQGIFEQQTSRIAASGYQDRFLLIGRKEEPQRYYAAADVFALTSREDPFPSVVLESLDVAVPVVAFEGTGGIGDLLNRCGGTLVPAFDTNAFSSMIERLLADPTSATRIGSRGQEIIGQEFNFRHYVFDLLEFGGQPIPRVSVVVPNYNYARYLSERLKSVTEQTLPIYELIILDDASTDNSIEVIQAFLSECHVPHTLVRNEKNSGSVFHQWLKGVEMARGEFVWIAEADDLADREFLETAIAGLREPKTVMSYTQSRQMSADGSILSHDYLEYVSDIDAVKWTRDYRSDGRREIAEALYIKNTIPNVSAVVFRRDALLKTLRDNRNEILSYRNAGDWVTYLRLLEQGSIAFFAKPLNSHRRHQGSVTIGNSNRRHLEEIEKVQIDTIHRFGLGLDTKAIAASYASRVRQQFGLAEFDTEASSAEDGDR